MNLNEFYDKITAVVNQILEQSIRSRSIGSCTITHENVANLISEDDFNRFFTVISNEMKSRGEVHALEFNGFDGTISFVLDPEVSAGVRVLKKLPTLSELLNSSSSSLIDENFIELSCYADQVLPHAAPAELVDDYDGAVFTVPRTWAEAQAKDAGYESLDEFLDDYTWDTTDGWYEKAFRDGVLLGVSVGGLNPNDRSLDTKIARAKEIASAKQVEMKAPEKSAERNC